MQFDQVDVTSAPLDQLCSQIASSVCVNRIILIRPPLVQLSFITELGHSGSNSVPKNSGLLPLMLLVVMGPVKSYILLI